MFAGSTADEQLELIFGKLGAPTLDSHPELFQLPGLRQSSPSATESPQNGANNCGGTKGHSSAKASSLRRVLTTSHHHKYPRSLVGILFYFMLTDKYFDKVFKRVKFELEYFLLQILYFILS
jgi:hypothetical protein